MKIVKALLYISIIVNFQVYANKDTFKANTNLVDQFELNDGAKWSFDGGFFKDTKQGIYIKESGLHKILILNSDGEIEIIHVTVVEGINASTEQSKSLYIDNKAPKLQLSWENIINQEGQITVGPKSRLNWKSNDPSAKFQVYINTKLSEINSPPLQFNNNISSLEIKSFDEFNNESISEIKFKQNFIGPDIEWKLAPPSLYKNNKWHSKKKAKLILSPQQGVSYKLNGKSIDLKNKALKLKNNSQLSATDYLGNKSTKIVSWVVDNDPPILIVNTLGTEQINIKKLSVKVNQDIHLSSKDAGVGLLNAYFFGKKRKWESLPKTFVFLDPGRYRIKVKSKDKFGNFSKNKIFINVTN